MNPHETVLQCWIASAVGLDEGHVSRIAGKLIDMGLAVRDSSGVPITDVGRLLEIWVITSWL